MTSFLMCTTAVSTTIRYLIIDVFFWRAAPVWSRVFQDVIFASPLDALVACILWYRMRKFEEHLGSRKYSVCSSG